MHAHYMFDRFINILTLIVVMISVGALGGNIYDEYTGVGYRFNISDPKPWEKYNEYMVIEENVASAEKIQSAIANARSADKKDDAKRLQEYYDRSYKSDGTRRTRMNSIDFTSAFIYAGVCLLFLLIPITVNYIRHGKPKVWNSNTLNKSSKRDAVNGIPS